ncbi:MAG: 3-hydroxyacyl-CoA dehydrogenase [Nakamurella sp.]
MELGDAPVQLTRATPVGVVGAGTMGAGIAQIAATAGHPVLLLDTIAGRAQIAIDGLIARLDRLTSRRKLTLAAAASVRSNLSAATDISDLAGCGLVIEAAVESLDVKRSIFTGLEAVVSEQCILATNTSSLSITAVAAALRRPERCVGMHFFNPAAVMRLVEVVSGLATDPQVANIVAALAISWGKTPVRVKSTPGFIVNRVARPFYGESLRALEEQTADAATIDAVLRECGGFRMGPLELTDLIGQDVNLAVSRSVWELLGQDPRYAPSSLQQDMVDAGRLGRKSGLGFYRYDRDAPVSEPSTAESSAAPSKVSLVGDWRQWNGLWERVTASGIDTVTADVEDGRELHAELPAGALLMPTDGRTATQRSVETGHPVITIDLTLDPATANRFAIAASDGCPAAAVRGAIGLLQATGAAVSVLDDLPGLLVTRTVAMLVNEAVDVVARGVATAADVDVAMRLGVGYPLGPLEWGDRIGAAAIVTVLDALNHDYPDGRYRACTRLRRVAWAGGNLRDL